jgi:hypothetical protein
MAVQNQAFTHFFKIFFALQSKIFDSRRHLTRNIKEKRLKRNENLQGSGKKFNFEPPFWIGSPFLVYLKYFVLISCFASQVTDSMQKIER